ncbi:hypothetical protein ABEF95_011188 [Exophiala dermatitidis]
MLSISTLPSSAPFLLPQIDLDITFSGSSRESLETLKFSMTEKRPKLSLQTSGLTPTCTASVSHYGPSTAKSSTTPTTSNTFANTFELALRPSPASAVSSPAVYPQQRTSCQQPSSTTTSEDQPYTLNLPFGVRSILKNGPLPKDIRRVPGCSASPSPWGTGRRVFFPAAKKVTFRTILEEEIVTKDYVRCHADLSSSDDDDDACISSSESEEMHIHFVQDRKNKSDGRRFPTHIDGSSSPSGRKRKSLTCPAALAGQDWTARKGDRSKGRAARKMRRKKRRWEWSADLTPFIDGAPAQTEFEAFIGDETMTGSQATEDAHVVCLYPPDPAELVSQL